MWIYIDYAYHILYNVYMHILYRHTVEHSIYRFILLASYMLYTSTCHHLMSHYFMSTITQWMCHCIYLFIFFGTSAVTTAAYASQLLMQLKGPGLTAPDCKYASMWWWAMQAMQGITHSARWERAHPSSYFTYVANLKGWIDQNMRKNMHVNCNLTGWCSHWIHCIL